MGVVRGHGRSGWGVYTRSRGRAGVCVVWYLAGGELELKNLHVIAVHRELG